jgi:hypothetical protein
MGRQKTEVDRVSDLLDSTDFIIIPTYEVGSVGPAYNGKGEVRDDAVVLTITNASKITYANNVWLKMEV